MQIANFKVFWRPENSNGKDGKDLLMCNGLLYIWGKTLLLFIYLDGRAVLYVKINSYYIILLYNMLQPNLLCDYFSLPVYFAYT